MKGVGADYSSYLHKYEAYRVPKNHEALKKNDVSYVESEDGSVFLLTEKAQKQLIKDRFAYGNMLFARANRAAQKTQEEALKKITSDQSKAMAVFRSMVKGDLVPAEDEKKLMEVNPNLYQSAKIAQMMAKEAQREKKHSMWDEQEEAERKSKMDQLSKASNELAANMGKDFQKFSEAQKASIVEADSEPAELSAIRSVVNLGGGIAGAIFDTVL